MNVVCEVRTVGATSIEKHLPDCNHFKTTGLDITGDMVARATLAVCEFRDPDHKHHPGLNTCAFNWEIVKLVLATLEEQ